MHVERGASNHVPKENVLTETRRISFHAAFFGNVVRLGKTVRG
jgi:hypothetical protein